MAEDNFTWTPPEVAAPVEPTPAPVSTADVDVVSPAGEHGTIPGAQLQDAMDQGYRIPSQEELTKFAETKKYSQPIEQLKTIGEGIGQGVAGPVFTAAETGLLGNEAEQRGRSETNPIEHGVGQVAGLVGPAILSAGASAAARAGVGGAELASAAAKAAEFSQAGVLEKAGNAVIKGLNLGGKEASILGKIGAKSVSEAAQMALLQGGDEVSKMIQRDPNQTAQTAITDIGLASVLGGAGGAVFGAVAPLWKASVGDRLGQVIEDFKARQANPAPTQEQFVDELGKHYNSTKAHTDEVFGPTGLKAEAVAKAMPEMHPGISEQAQGFANKLEDSIVKMEQKPNSFPERLVSKARDDFEAYRTALQDPHATPEQIFNATQDLKQTMQGYAKFDKFVKPVDEAYDFVREAKNMAHSLREGLEDKEVWGDAAKIQQSINKKFTEYLPTLKDFEKKFTVEVNGDRVIDPGKAQTYLNQLGKPNAEIKQTMLENYLRESEGYRNVISDTHAGLGVDSPVEPSSLSAVKATLQKLTPGMKLADQFNKHGIYELAGEALGTGTGGALGAMVGHPALGAIIGERGLSPFFKSVLPGLVKPFQSRVATSSGAKAAIEYGLAVARGETVLNKAAKGIFRESGESLLHLVPSEGDRTKLDKALKAAETHPDSMTKIAGDIGHFMPDHATALATTTSNAVVYLNSLRPDTAPKNPLDPKIPANPVAKASYNRALDLANKPLLAVAAIKKGTLTPQDVVTVKTLYPDLYASMSQKLTNEMITHVSKGDMVPYTQRLQLSLFLGQPLDSTMTPSAIIAAQSKPQQSQNQPSEGQSSKPPAAASVKGLDKLSQMSTTPVQSRAASRAMNKG